MSQCTYLGPEYDVRTWDYTSSATPYCGAPCVPGKSYCHEHYYVVYKKGTSVNSKRLGREIERELASLKQQQEIEEIVNE